jgi:malate synthase
VCGFAWIKIRPATSAFAKWLVKTGKARPAYGGGLSIWISAHNQSMERKEAHARAMAKVLSEKLGINCYAESRMD